MRTALIVGAGIGGLAAGIALRQAGWKVRIFERTATSRELGFGVGLAPNAIAALGELGLADLVMERGFAPMRARGEIRRMDGRGPFVMAMRPALHGVLLDGVGMDAITLASEATGFALDGGLVTLHLANGSTAEGDLLVGADGVSSVIRRALHPAEPPPKSSGIVAVRGAAHGGRSALSPAPWKPSRPPIGPEWS